MQYEVRLAQARANLPHVNSCIALFEVSREPSAVPPWCSVTVIRFTAAGGCARLSVRRRLSASFLPPKIASACWRSSPIVIARSSMCSGRGTTVQCCQFRL